jgi:hypothetical protein
VTTPVDFVLLFETYCYELMILPSYAYHFDWIVFVEKVILYSCMFDLGMVRYETLGKLSECSLLFDNFFYIP